jgi:hypothetical protein
MISKMIVVGSSSQGYETAAKYLVKTNLGDAAMAFFPHIQSHIIRDAIQGGGKIFSPLDHDVIISPDVFYVAGKFQVSELGYSGGLNYRFSIQDENRVKKVHLNGPRTEDPIDDHFMAMCYTERFWNGWNRKRKIYP